MSTYGYNLVTRIGRSIQVTADGELESKAGGITLAWAAVTAAASDYEVRPAGETVNASFLNNVSPADDYVYTGEKFIRYGTVVCRISGGTLAGKFAPYGSTSIGGGTLLKTRGNVYILNESVHEDDTNSDHAGQPFEGGLVFKDRLKVNFAVSQTITMTATGGTFTVTYGGQTTGAQAYNVTASNLQTAIQGLSSVGTGNATVSLSGNVYTIVFNEAALGVPSAITLGVGSLTGGSATVGTTQDGSYGPTEAEFLAMFPRIRFVNEI